MHLANPTRIKPSRSSGSSGRKAHASASWNIQHQHANLDGLNNSYHQERSNNPIDEDAETNLDPDPTLSEDMVQRFVSYFAKNRVHHDQETDCLHWLASP